MSDSFPPRNLLEADPQTAALIAAEERRQREKIIMIPSESLTPMAVREALASPFTSVYAEGYPRRAMMDLPPERLADIDEQLANYRRYADRRFYKGTEFADLVESLAARRAAESFATPEYPASRIHANVQPLSGAAANLAVYEAFVEPGETVMGMALTEGGHLTHGSEFNVTGKRYRIVSYSVDPGTGRLDYDRIGELAEEYRPRMIIGGFTSYPWKPDWARFREIADSVGAILLADVAHTAGMIIGGVYPNPVGYADVISFTTHKTLCGPRGAVILATDPKIARRIDTAIFPGQQGGPHVNKFAAIAVALKLAQRPEFAELQRRIVANATALAEGLKENGITLAYGGTDTHLLVIDLKGIESETGFPLMGEIAARILDLAGIVCNKNTIPGDRSAADARGIRLGTPWATQRGMTEDDMRELASIISRVLKGIRPFSYPGLNGELSRGKIPLSTLEEARREVCGLLARVEPGIERRRDEIRADGSGLAALRVRGGRSRALLNEATPSDILSLPAGKACRTYLFDEDGKGISAITVGAIGDEDFIVLVPWENKKLVEKWLTGLADGYIIFDRDDLFRKVQGPAVIEEIAADDLPPEARGWLDTTPEAEVTGSPIGEVLAGHPERFALEKPYFIGQGHLELSEEDPSRTDFSWSEDEGEPKRTALHRIHKDLGARFAPFAGWEMPLWYGSALAEHRAVRRAAGLFDLGHMGVFQIEGDGAAEFLNVVTSNYAGWLEDGQSQYAYLFDPDGNVIDDVMVYRRSRDRYLMVVNAANEAKDWEWLNGVNDGRYLIDREIPKRRIVPRVRIRDLKDERGVIDIALQGPLSRDILIEAIGRENGPTLDSLERTKFCELIVSGHQLLIARTGYTGEPLGYEIYLTGEDGRWLWERLIELGRPIGLLPCGLAARDSTRTEAGLPLYGHELAGPYGIDPFEAGFASYVKLHKPFFIGRSEALKSYLNRNREVVRFTVDSEARPVRPGGAVLDRNGTVIGRVTSSVSLGPVQVGMALLERIGLGEGEEINLLNEVRGEAGKPTSRLESGDRVAVPIYGRIAPRFPTRMPISDGGE